MNPKELELILRASRLTTHERFKDLVLSIVDRVEIPARVLTMVLLFILAKPLDRVCRPSA